LGRWSVRQRKRKGRDQDEGQQLRKTCFIYGSWVTDGV
jgi:hypothetical protein